MIHPTAVIHPKACLDSTVHVGPYAVIDEGVTLGADCIVGPHVYLTGDTKIGVRNRIHAGAVIGDAPQDLKYHGEPTRVRIGSDNVFREHVTVNRSTTVEGETVIGSNNFIMAHAHIAHNCAVGDHVILANGVLLAGHVVVQDRVFLSGNCVVHQFSRIGTLAMMQGGTALSQDLPPFTVSVRLNEICGLNVVGLRRAGFGAEERKELKRLYHALFRSGCNMRQALEQARSTFSGNAARTMIEFITQAKHGVCADIGQDKSVASEDPE